MQQFGSLYDGEYSISHLMAAAIIGYTSISITRFTSQNQKLFP